MVNLCKFLHQDVCGVEEDIRFEICINLIHCAADGEAACRDRITHVVYKKCIINLDI